MINEPTVRGYRVAEVPTRKQKRDTRFDYLHQSADAAELHNVLWEFAPVVNAPCVGDDRYTSDELMPWYEAELACRPCPLWDICDAYRRVAKPVHGIYAGVVTKFVIEED